LQSHHILAAGAPTETYVERNNRTVSHSFRIRPLVTPMAAMSLSLLMTGRRTDLIEGRAGRSKHLSLISSLRPAAEYRYLRARVSPTAAMMDNPVPRP
jgi:hypothetical protein